MPVLPVGKIIHSLISLATLLIDLNRFRVQYVIKKEGEGCLSGCLSVLYRIHLLAPGFTSIGTKFRVRNLLSINKLNAM